MAKTTRKSQSPKTAAQSILQPDDYFVWPHWFWMILIAFGFYLLFTATFKPSHALRFLPEPMSDIVYYMGTSQRHLCIIIVTSATVIHCLEAAYAGKICQDVKLTTTATIKWTFMTFVFGIASLWHLLQYKRQKNSKQR